MFSLSIVIFGESGKSPSQICKANDDYGVSHDTCVVCVAQGALEGVFSPTCSCKILEEGDTFFGSLEDHGFDDLGDCISSGFSILK
jgi:hypothetical protein